MTHYKLDLGGGSGENSLLLPFSEDGVTDLAYQELTLPDNAREAVKTIREASREIPVLVFKKSPVCPLSRWAAEELQEFLDGATEGTLAVAEIDVIHQKPLARGLTQELDIPHESPQALFFRGGDLTAHDSHERLTKEWFQERLASANGE